MVLRCIVASKSDTHDSSFLFNSGEFQLFGTKYSSEHMLLFGICVNRLSIYFIQIYAAFMD